MPAKTIPNIPKNVPKGIKVEKVLVEWTSPARPHKKRNREFYTTVFSIVFLLTVILFFLKEFLLIGVVLSFGFLSYVLASHPPENVKHQVTTKGVRTEDKLFPWDSFTNFWIKKQWDQELVVIMTKNPYPGNIMAVIEPRKRDAILKAIGDKIPLEKPEDSFVDRSSRWLQEKVPLENS